jgi:Do/DeqQ family serine protease
MMNKRNRLLTGLLLVLIGVLMGGFFVMMQRGEILQDRSTVNFTEVKKSERPLFSDTDLEKLDARFLFKNVADRVIPTVVYITTVVQLENGKASGEEDDFWDRLRPRRARTVGSGVLVSENGYIVTNNHVIEGAVDEGILVTLNDKRLFDARIVGTDPTTDLAILKVDGEALPAVTFGNSNEVNVGEWVLAVGNPLSLRSTVTAGIVSALSRQVQIPGETANQLRVDSFIQTDAAINKGNSGGPLVNTSGELVGINTAIATQSGSNQGYGFAVPSNLVRKVMEDLIEFGEVHRALLGVSIVSVDFERAQELGLPSVKGVEIMGLSDGGAAQRHNIQQNDIILAVNGNMVNESNELQEKIAVKRPGETVRLKIWRNSSIIEREVELGRLQSSGPMFAGREEEEPPAEDGIDNPHGGIAFATFDLGFKVMTLSIPGNTGTKDLIIAEIFSDSEAARQGLKEGYIIRQVNGEPVESLDELEKQLAPGSDDTGAIMLKIETPDGATGFYELKQ